MEDGVTESEARLACPTVMDVELEIELKLAEIVAVPCPELAARP